MKIVIYKTPRCGACPRFIENLRAALKENELLDEPERFAVRDADLAAEDGVHGISTVPTTVIFTDIEPKSIFPGVYPIEKIIEEAERICDKEYEMGV